MPSYCISVERENKRIRTVRDFSWGVQKFHFGGQKFGYFPPPLKSLTFPPPQRQPNRNLSPTPHPHPRFLSLELPCRSRAPSHRNRVPSPASSPPLASTTPVAVTGHRPPRPSRNPGRCAGRRTASPCVPIPPARHSLHSHGRSSYSFFSTSLVL